MAEIGKPFHLVVILLFFSTRAWSVPTSAPHGGCKPTEALKVVQDRQMELECSSMCNRLANTVDEFEWLRSNNMGGKEDMVVMESRESKLVVKSVDYVDEGTYKCRCLPEGQFCEQKVYIIPVMDFIASDMYIYAGDSVELSCTVDSLQEVYPTITLSTGESLDATSHEEEHHMDGEYGRVTDIWLYEQKNLKQVYVCTMDIYGGEELLRTLEENLTIYSYIKPKILYTTEIKLASSDNFGESGKLSCTIVTSPDTGSKVVWIFKGKELPLNQSRGKYTVDSIPREKEVVEHVLVIADIQQRDLGAYVCRLDSTFGTEDKQEAWVRLSTQEDEKSAGSEVNAGGRVWTLYFICICGVGIVILGVWYKRRGGKNKRMKLV